MLTISLNMSPSGIDFILSFIRRINKICLHTQKSGFLIPARWTGRRYSAVGGVKATVSVVAEG
jgi:hypothetical protein